MENSYVEQVVLRLKIDLASCGTVSKYNHEGISIFTEDSVLILREDTVIFSPNISPLSLSLSLSLSLTCFCRSVALLSCRDNSQYFYSILFNLFSR